MKNKLIFFSLVFLFLLAFTSAETKVFDKTNYMGNGQYNLSTVNATTFLENGIRLCTSSGLNCGGVQGNLTFQYNQTIPAINVAQNFTDSNFIPYLVNLVQDINIRNASGSPVLFVNFTTGLVGIRNNTLSGLPSDIDLAIGGNNGRVALVGPNPRLVTGSNTSNLILSGGTNLVDGAVVRPYGSQSTSSNNGSVVITTTGNGAGMFFSSDINGISTSGGEIRQYPGFAVWTVNGNLTVNPAYNGVITAPFFYGDGRYLTNVPTFNTTYNSFAYNQTTGINTTSGWNVSGNSLYTSNLGNNIGIGTSNPRITLDIISNAGDIAYFQNGPGNPNAVPVIQLQYNNASQNTTQNGAFIGDINFGTTFNGVDNPSAQEVSRIRGIYLGTGTQRTGGLVFSTGNGGSPQEKMRLDNNGNLFFIANNANLTLNGTNQRFGVNTNTPGSTLSINGGGFIGSNSQTQPVTTNNFVVQNAIAVGAGTNDTTITSRGWAGIFNGTVGISPDGKTTGGPTFTSNRGFFTEVYNGETIVVFDSGNGARGTGLLSGNGGSGSAFFQIATRSNSASYTPGLTVGRKGSLAPGVYVGNSYNENFVGDYKFTVDGNMSLNSTMYFPGSGFVGIGNSTPIATLDIESRGPTAALRITNSSGGTANQLFMVNSTTGQVNIGSGCPAYSAASGIKLCVNGLIGGNVFSGTSINPTGGTMVINGNNGVSMASGMFYVDSNQADNEWGVSISSPASATAKGKAWFFGIVNTTNALNVSGTLYVTGNNATPTAKAVGIGTDRPMTALDIRNGNLTLNSSGGVILYTGTNTTGAYDQRQNVGIFGNETAIKFLLPRADGSDINPAMTLVRGNSGNWQLLGNGNNAQCSNPFYSLRGAETTGFNLASRIDFCIGAKPVARFENAGLRVGNWIINQAGIGEVQAGIDIVYNTSSGTGVMGLNISMYTPTTRPMVSLQDINGTTTAALRKETAFLTMDQGTGRRYFVDLRLSNSTGDALVIDELGNMGIKTNLTKSGFALNVNGSVNVGGDLFNNGFNFSAYRYNQSTGLVPYVGATAITMTSDIGDKIILFSSPDYKIAVASADLQIITSASSDSITLNPNNVQTLRATNGDIYLPTLAGGGNQFVCVDNDGKLYASGVACV